MYLYRAVDQKGRTVASYLGRHRDQAAARVFFRSALKRHGQPRTITLNGSSRVRNEFNFFGVVGVIGVGECELFKDAKLSFE